MAIIIGAALLLGMWLDKKFPNKFSGFTIGITLLGVFVALFQVIRKVSRMSKEQ